jgi:hypothetical protein
MSQQNNNRHCGLPVELMNELFAAMPFKNAFGLLAKKSNGLLARNVHKMINGIKMVQNKYENSNKINFYKFADNEGKQIVFGRFWVNID